MNITIVTAVWGDYGKYIPEWLDSIEAQTVRPDAVVIVNAGLDDDLAVRIRLASCPIPWRYLKIPYTGVGPARNAAVRAARTEWVMHLDADDTLYPYAIEKAATVADGADVIAINGERDGKLWDFARTTAARVLSGNLACYSCAPFRRELWERRPYIEINDWVDSAFWIGLAHLGARFVGIKDHRPHFVYRQHPDSHSKTITRDQKREAMIQFHRLLKGWDL